MGRGVCAVNTHKNALYNNLRAHSALSGDRPAHAVWCALADGSVAAAACSSPEDVVVMRPVASDPRILLLRGQRASVGGVVHSLCARARHIFCGRADGAFVVLRASGSPDIPPEILSVVQAAGCPLVRLASIAPPRLAVAVDAKGDVVLVTGPPSAARAKTVFRPPRPARPTAIAARRARPAAPWEAAVADACGGVCVLSAGGARRVEGCEYGDVRALEWEDDDGGRLLVAGEDDLVSFVKTGRAGARADGEGMERADVARTEAMHSSFVTGLARRGKRVISVGMDGRLVLWEEVGLGEVLVHLHNEAFYHVEWEEDDVVYASTLGELVGKCYLYRFVLERATPR